MSLTIEQLQLSLLAEGAARTLLSAHPSVRFTSGRRSLWEQAHAMAVNVLLNRQWIGQTYLHAAVLQTWVDAQPAVLTLDGLACGLYDQLCAWSDAEQRALSAHLTGEAFDVMPMIDEQGLVTAEGHSVLDTIGALPGLTRLLQREGGLIRWHAQFSSASFISSV